MSDNVASTAAQELKKWLETLEKLLSKMESEKIAAAKSKLESDRFDAMVKELKEIKEGINKLPDDTPGKKEAIERTQKVEQKIDPDAPGNDLDTPGTGLDVNAPNDDLATEVGNNEIEEAGELAQDEAGEQALDGPGKQALDGPGEQALEGPGPAIQVRGRSKSVGDDLGWAKTEKGWVNGEGQSIQEIVKNLKLPSTPGVGISGS